MAIHAGRYLINKTTSKYFDSRCCHWGFFLWFPPAEPHALRSTQPLKVSTRDFSWGKGGQCKWVMTYHPCSAETSRKSGALTYLEPLGPPWPVAGDIYLQLSTTVHLLVLAVHYIPSSNLVAVMFLLLFALLLVLKPV